MEINLVEIATAATAVSTVLVLLWRYFFSPFAKFTKKLRTNSKKIVDALPLLVAIAEHWPLVPESGSLESIIKRIKSDIHKGQEWNRLILDCSAIIAVEADEEGACLWTSKEWLKSTGLSLKESVGDGWLTGVKEEDRERVAREWSLCIKHNRVFDVHFFISNRNDQDVRVRGVGHVVSDELNKKLGMIAVFSKI
jgi:PAS domain S-box-containing protein